MKEKQNIRLTRKIINVILFLLFGLFAYFQFNDPDKLLWIFIYGVVSLTCLMGTFRYIPRIAYYALLAGLLVFAIYLSPGVIDWLSNDNKAEVFGEMKGDRPYIETTREFIGLLMAAGAIFYQKTSSL